MRMPGLTLIIVPIQLIKFQKRHKDTNFPNITLFYGQFDYVKCGMNSLSYLKIVFVDPGSRFNPGFLE
jgi:hypothetical protein